VPKRTPGDAGSSIEGSPMVTDSNGEVSAVSAGRNQSLFRAINEKLKVVSDVFEGRDDHHVLACECADLKCIQTLEISPAGYRKVREDDKHFVVLHDHVYSEVERVIDRQPSFEVVEKFGRAGEIASAAAEDPPRS
jgi:hypothetical protein